MPSPSTKLDASRDFHNQAVSSVAQEMTSARLRILSDLMDSRKKAEANEQEFLKTIHSENAAFSKLVSLFEDSVDELRSSLISLRREIGEKATDAYHESSTAQKQLSTHLDDFKRQITDEIRVVNEANKATQDSCDNRVVSLQGVIDTHHNTVTAEIAVLRSELQGGLTEITTDRAQTTGSIRARLQEVESLAASFANRLQSLQSLFDQRLGEQLGIFQELVRNSRNEIETSFELRLADTESRIQSYISEQLHNISSQLEASFESRLSTLSTEREKEAQDIASRYESRFGEIEELLRSNKDDETMKFVDEEKLAEFKQVVENKIDQSVSQNRDHIVEEIESLETRLSSSIHRQDMALRAVATSGYFHEWTIRDAKSKLQSLGLLSSGGKFVSSEIFSIGPYSNLQLRLYPLSSSLASNTSVWLIHAPGSDQNGPSLPVFVDLGIGRSRRALCRMKKVQELFGHWIWEGSGFDRDVIEKEVDNNGSLVVSVEISMRQWLASNNDTVLTSMSSENFPESPMSAYTFADGTSTPQLPLRPLSTNPFDNEMKKKTEEKPSALTPRRMSWAMFGDHADDEGASASSCLNPFSR